MFFVRFEAEELDVWAGWEIHLICLDGLKVWLFGALGWPNGKETTALTPAILTGIRVTAITRSGAIGKKADRWLSSVSLDARLGLSDPQIIRFGPIGNLVTWEDRHRTEAAPMRVCQSGGNASDAHGGGVR